MCICAERVQLRLACGLTNIARMTRNLDNLGGPGRVPNLNRLGLRCQVAREDAGMSQTELADAIGSSRGTVSNYERGSVTPRKQVLALWAYATGVDARWLITGKAPNTDPGVDSELTPELVRMAARTGLRAVA